MQTLIRYLAFIDRLNQRDDLISRAHYVSAMYIQIDEFRLRAFCKPTLAQQMKFTVIFLQFRMC